MGIGSRLEKIMKAKGTNANELAQKMGVTPSTIYSMIRRDSNRVDIDLLIKLAKALDMTADEIISGKVHEKADTLAAHFEGNEFSKEEIADIENYVDFVKTKRKN